MKEFLPLWLVLSFIGGAAIDSFTQKIQTKNLPERDWQKELSVVELENARLRLKLFDQTLVAEDWVKAAKACGKVF